MGQNPDIAVHERLRMAITACGKFDGVANWYYGDGRICVAAANKGVVNDHPITMIGFFLASHIANTDL